MSFKKRRKLRVLTSYKVLHRDKTYSLILKEENIGNRNYSTTGPPQANLLSIISALISDCQIQHCFLPSRCSRPCTSAMPPWFFFFALIARPAIFQKKKARPAVCSTNAQRPAPKPSPGLNHLTTSQFFPTVLLQTGSSKPGEQLFQALGRIKSKLGCTASFLQQACLPLGICFALIAIQRISFPSGTVRTNCTLYADLEVECHKLAFAPSPTGPSHRCACPEIADQFLKLVVLSRPMAVPRRSIQNRATSIVMPY